MRWQAIVSSALLALACGGDPLHAQSARDTMPVELVPFKVVHRPVLSVFVEMRVEGDTVLLPLSQLLTELQMEHRLDVRGGTLRLGKRTVAVPTSGPRVSLLEVYVTAAALDSLTGLHATIETNSLTVTITADTELPITTAARRARARPRQLGGAIENDSAVPLLHPRNRRWLGANVVEYLATSTVDDGRSSGMLDLHAGGELAGGELEMRVRGSRLSSGATQVQRGDARWRFVMARGPVTQVLVGRQSSGGIQPLTFTGVEITNRPALPRANAGLHVVEGTARPDWTVEIYVNDRLAGSTQANALGRWRAEVPVGFGASTVRLRFVGLNGEVREEEQLLQVPFGLVPSGTMEYAIAGGQLPHAQGTVLTGRAAYGLTEWLTLRGGTDATRGARVDDAAATLSSTTSDRTNRSSNAPVLYAGFTARMLRIANLAVDVAPSMLSRAAFEMRGRTQASLGLTATSWSAQAGAVAQGMRQEVSGQAWLPMTLRALPLTTRLSGTIRTMSTGERQQTSTAELLAQLGGFSPSLQYRAEQRDGVSQQELRTGVQLFAGRMLPQPFHNAFIRAMAGANLGTRRVGSVELYVGRPIGTRAQADLSWSRDAITRASRTELRLSWRLGVARIAGATRLANGRVAFEQSAGGSLAFDAATHQVMATDRPIVGRAAAAVRLFLDANGNGRLDGDEQPIRGARVRITGDQALGHGNGRVSDLLAYSRYVARVDKASLANPLWIPTHDAVAFIADPNRIKAIDVPLYPGASIEGRVVQRRTPTDSGSAVPGLRLQLLREDGAVSVALPTFADGAFYHPGLPPGTYLLRVDPAQLERLGMTASPAQRRVTIVPTPEGAQLEGLGFVLQEVTPADGKVP